MSEKGSAGIDKGVKSNEEDEYSTDPSLTSTNVNSSLLRVNSLGLLGN